MANSSGRQGLKDFLSAWRLFGIPYGKEYHVAVQALALASLDEVNEMWAGLGYYRRASYLLDGSKFVMQVLHGKFPSTSAELQRIPGADLPMQS